MKFAICIWDMDVSVGLLDSLLADGVEFVEPGFSFFDMRPTAKAVSELAELRSVGIAVRSAHAPFGSDVNISSLEAAVRTAAVDALSATVEKAVEADVGVLVVHPDHRVSPSLATGDELRWAMDGIAAIAEVSERLDGPILAVENMPPGHPLSGFSDVMKIAGEVDSPKVGVCLDTGHAFLRGESLGECYRAAGEKLANIHFHDNDGVWDKHIQPPYGATDWRDFVDVLTDSPPPFPISVEAPPFAGGTRRQMLDEVSALLSSRLVQVDARGRKAFCRCVECGGVVWTDDDTGATHCRCSDGFC